MAKHRLDNGYGGEVKLVARVQLRKAATRPTGPGWVIIPSGKHGGYHKRGADGAYDYWYPSAEHAKKAAEHHEARSTHWRAAEHKANRAGDEVKGAAANARANRHWRLKAGAERFIRRQGATPLAKGAVGGDLVELDPGSQAYDVNGRVRAARFGVGGRHFVFSHPPGRPAILTCEDTPSRVPLHAVVAGWADAMRKAKEIASDYETDRAPRHGVYRAVINGSKA